MLRLFTFGGLGLVSDDGSAAPRLRPPRLALLAALAAAGERGMSRERLMAYFWPDSDETHGRHSLRQALYALRQELGVDVVESNGATLSLDGSLLGGVMEYTVGGCTYLHAFDALLVSDEELDRDLAAAGLERRRTLDPRGAWLEAVPVAPPD